MATSTPKITLGGLARKLVQDNLLAASVAEEAFQKAIQSKIPFVTYIVREKLVASKDVAYAAAQEFGVPLVDIDLVDVDQDTIKLVDKKLITKHNTLPLFKRGKRLYIAVSDPTNFLAIDEIKFHVNMQVEPILVDEERLAKVIERALEAADKVLAGLDEEDPMAGIEEEDAQATADAESVATSDAEDAPVVKFVNKMLMDAIKIGASDLHFEPYEKYYRVRFRIDGMLRTIAKPPLSLKLKMAARIKVMSRMDVSERRVPQDGRIKLKLSKTKSIDFRVSTCPTLYGEKVVMRILNSDAASLNIEMLGYEPEQKRLFLENLERPYGMLLVTGPTGSGKTVSLYTGINILNRESVNISTAEDPVEINLPGVNQVQIDERTGMTFDKALKAFLRQDPDIILVGEIRDIVTGGIAIKAASTGHMVMATLHTNDAPQTLTRMMDMGIAPFAIATAVNLITAQRLTRRLCKTCKMPLEMTTDVVKDPDKEIHRDALLAEGFKKEDLVPGFKIYKPKPGGCEACSGNGYKGRAGIYQVMPISDEMKRLIMSGANSIAIADQARKEGIPDLRESGIKKVRDGITSLEELNRVTQE
jgi:type IV pilus assembly protein PilB